MIWWIHTHEHEYERHTLKSLLNIVVCFNGSAGFFLFSFSLCLYFLLFFMAFLVQWWMFPFALLLNILWTPLHYITKRLCLERLLSRVLTDLRIKCMLNLKSGNICFRFFSFPTAKVLFIWKSFRNWALKIWNSITWDGIYEITLRSNSFDETTIKSTQFLSTGILYSIWFCCKCRPAKYLDLKSK